MSALIFLFCFAKHNFIMQVILGTETEDYVSNVLIFDLSIIFTAMIEMSVCSAIAVCELWSGVRNIEKII
jgi:hypothetical protein